MSTIMNIDTSGPIGVRQDIFERLVRSATAGVWVIDKDGRTVLANDALGRMLDTTAAEMRGRLFTEFMDSAEVPLALRYLAERKSGEAETHEFRFRGASGREVWAAVAGAPIELAGDEAPLFVGILVEVGPVVQERRRADLLQQSLEAMLPLLRDALAITSADGRIALANRAFEKLTRTPEGTAVGRMLESVLPERASGKLNFSMGAAMPGVQYSTFPMERADGSRETFRLSSIALATATQAVAASVHVLAEQHREADDVAQLETFGEASWLDQQRAFTVELQSAAMQAAPEGMAILRGDTFVFVNPAHAAVYGWTVGDLVGQTWRVLYSDSAQHWLSSEGLPRLLADGEWQGEIVGLRKDGSPVDVSLSLTLLAGGYLMCCCRDISARKQQEREMQRALESLDTANAQLQAAARVKDVFLATMSHELRTPLHSLLGTIEALHERYLGPLLDPQSEYLRRALESGRHLGALIDDILDVSRISANELKLDRGKVDVLRASRAAVDILWPELRRKGQSISWEHQPDATFFAAADERRVVQIITNLLSNGIKFTERGGALVISLDASVDTVAVAVADSGPCISREDIPHLFEPFRQLASSGTRREPGTGLGLFLSRALARAQQGDITVVTEPGHGSRFTLRLPRLAAPGRIIETLEAEI